MRLIFSYGDKARLTSPQNRRNRRCLRPAATADALNPHLTFSFVRLLERDAAVVDESDGVVLRCRLGL